MVPLPQQISFVSESYVCNIFDHERRNAFASLENINRARPFRFRDRRAVGSGRPGLSGRPEPIFTFYSSGAGLAAAMKDEDLLRGRAAVGVVLVPRGGDRECRTPG